MGFSRGGVSAVCAGMIKEVKREHPEAGMGSLMGVFAAGRGLGAVVSGPVSEVEVEGRDGVWIWDGVWCVDYFYGY
jgi:hypothetical protein